jgi:hypothetical protein
MADAEVTANRRPQRPEMGATSPDAKEDRHLARQEASLRYMANQFFQAPDHTAKDDEAYDEKLDAVAKRVRARLVDEATASDWNATSEQSRDEWREIVATVLEEAKG